MISHREVQPGKVVPFKLSRRASSKSTYKPDWYQTGWRLTTEEHHECCSAPLILLLSTIRLGNIIILSLIGAQPVQSSSTTTVMPTVVQSKGGYLKIFPTLLNIKLQTLYWSTSILYPLHAFCRLKDSYEIWDISPCWSVLSYCYEPQNSHNIRSCMNKLFAFHGIFLWAIQV